LGGFSRKGTVENGLLPPRRTLEDHSGNQRKAASAGILIFVGAFVYGLGPVLSMMVAIGGIIVFALGCLLLGLELIRNQRGGGVATVGK
jgi:hypothetical protein